MWSSSSSRNRTAEARWFHRSSSTWRIIADQRHVRAQRRGEQLLALVGVGLDERAARLGQLDVAFLQHGEPQQLQRLAQRQQLVGLELQRCRQRRQVGAPVVRRAGQGLHQAGHQVGADARAAAAPTLAHRRRRRACGSAPGAPRSSARRCRPPSGGRPGPGGCADAARATCISARPGPDWTRTPGCGRTSAPPPRCCG